jgi:hypothetical protein
LPIPPVQFHVQHLAQVNLAPAPVAAAPLLVAPVPEVENAGVEEEGGEAAVVEVDVVGANGKRTRETRKFTLWNFVDRIDANFAYCKCGCLENDGASRKKFSAPNTGLVRRHVEKLHPRLYSLFSNCQNNLGNYNELITAIAALDGAAVEKVAKRRRHSDQFFIKSSKLDRAAATDLRLVLWAVANGISRNALNDTLFDSYLKSLGCDIPPNRQTLQERHLPVLDDLVTSSMIDQLKSVLSVSTSSDGWRDRARRDWINVVVTWCDVSATDPKKWEIYSIEPDLIFLPSSATADTIAYLINNALDSVVPTSFFVSYSIFTQCSCSCLRIA